MERTIGELRVRVMRSYHQQASYFLQAGELLKLRSLGASGRGCPQASRGSSIRIGTSYINAYWFLRCSPRAVRPWHRRCWRWKRRRRRGSPA